MSYLTNDEHLGWVLVRTFTAGISNSYQSAPSLLIGTCSMLLDNNAPLRPVRSY